MDVEMPYTFRYAFLNSKLKKGELTEADIDLSTERWEYFDSELLKLLDEAENPEKECSVIKEK